MLASIPIEKALNPYGDAIVAYEMNGETLPRDHGFPVRLLAPGHAGCRNVIGIGADYTLYDDKNRKIGSLDHRIINLGGSWMVKLDGCPLRGSEGTRGRMRGELRRPLDPCAASTFHDSSRHVGVRCPLACARPGQCLPFSPQLISCSYLSPKASSYMYCSNTHTQ